MLLILGFTKYRNPGNRIGPSDYAMERDARAVLGFQQPSIVEVPIMPLSSQSTRVTTTSPRFVFDTRRYE